MKFPQENNFTSGQKVYGYYHHTFNVNSPMVGKIICRLFKKKHHFSGIRYGDKNTLLCDWYLVWFKGNILPSVFPETCLNDLSEEIQKSEKFIQSNLNRIGEKGYDIDSFLCLENYLKMCKDYAR